METPHELDRIPGDHDSEPVITDADAKERARSADFLEITDVLKIGGSLNVTNGVPHAAKPKTDGAPPSMMRPSGGLNAHQFSSATSLRPAKTSSSWSRAANR